MLSKKHRERLEMAAKELRAWQPNQKLAFDMGTFGTVSECGTVCCAAGYLAQRPWFNKQGLTWHARSFLVIRYSRARNTRAEDASEFDQLASFFGLPRVMHDGALWNFFYTDAKRPQVIAARIESFLKEDARS